MLTSAEGYLNRYRNGWAASSAATKAWVEEMVRRRGKPLGGQAPVPLVDLPVPVPISRFLWPFVSPSPFSVAWPHFCAEAIPLSLLSLPQLAL